MKTTLLSAGLWLAAGLACACQAQTNVLNRVSQGDPTSTAVASATDTTAANDSTIAMLDKVIASNGAGNKAATIEALQTSSAALEQEAGKSTTSFKDKLMSQAGNLKKLIPLAQTGALGGNVLQKAIGLAKMAFAANKLQSLMGGGRSLLSNVGGLTSNLNVLKGALPLIGGGSSNTGNSLISGALGGLSKLRQAGPAASAAEPAVRGQLNNVLGFVKGVL